MLEKVIKLNKPLNVQSNRMSTEQQYIGRAELWNYVKLESKDLI